MLFLSLFCLILALVEAQWEGFRGVNPFPTSAPGKPLFRQAHEPRATWMDWIQNNQFARSRSAQLPSSQIWGAKGRPTYESKNPMIAPSFNRLADKTLVGSLPEDMAGMNAYKHRIPHPMPEGDLDSEEPMPPTPPSAQRDPPAGDHDSSKSSSPPEASTDRPAVDPPIPTPPFPPPQSDQATGKSPVAGKHDHPPASSGDMGYIRVNETDMVPTSTVTIDRQTEEGNFVHICSGSIIEERFILTAAHCVLDLDLFVSTGLADLSKRPSPNADSRHQQAKVVLAVTNPDYDFTEGYAYINDIALLKLEKPLKLDQNEDSNGIRAIPIGSGRDTFDFDVLVQGWDLSNRPEDDNLFRGYKTVAHDPQECDELMQPSPYTIKTYLHLCVSGFGTEACKGDLGGPLIADGKLIGISSWQDQDKGCAHYPAVYTNVSYYSDWITQTMGFMKSLEPL